MGLSEGKLEGHTRIFSNPTLKVCTGIAYFLVDSLYIQSINLLNLFFHGFFFGKSVDGQYVEEGWVDKTCKVCKKDTAGEPRQVDKLGRYVHVACLEKSNSGNFFTRLFSR